MPALAAGASAPSMAACSALCPIVHQFGNLYCCAAHGAEHLCDRNCRFRRHDSSRGGSVCAISQRLFAYAPQQQAGRKRAAESPPPAAKHAAFAPASYCENRPCGDAVWLMGSSTAEPWPAPAAAMHAMEQ